MTETPLTIAGHTFRSRLFIGTGHYPSHAVMKACHEASGAELDAAVPACHHGRDAIQPLAIDSGEDRPTGRRATHPAGRRVGA